MNFIAEPLYRSDLREYARGIRKQIGYSSKLCFPVGRFLEVFHELINDEDFYFECVQDDYFPSNTHAVYDVDDNCVRVRDSVYVNAMRGNGRDRMTIMHELSHVLLIKVSGIKLYRTMSNCKIEFFRDPEWHAKCLAGEIMVPAHLVSGMTAQDIAIKCGVSMPAAEYQLRFVK